ncbi:MAG: winged helix-turn-helix transcriptional regulator [Proteobacteria bacterium]|nr:winged helix-turn-helix transcriptional regulator [Pseudomonadota bacterium]
MTAPPGDPEAWDSLHARPGFLIRRLHQIHLALFAEECGAFGVTPVQYSLLTAVAANPGLDQSAVALLVGIDRATTANVLARLEANGLLRRDRGPTDARVKLIALTAAGRRMLRRMDGAARRAHERTLEGIPPAERARFVRSLARLVDAGNAHGRAPMQAGRED